MAEAPSRVHKKPLQAMAASFNPAEVEKGWYAWWRHSGFFEPAFQPDAERFVMVIPPPNVTGTLHLGHGITAAIQDSLTRWHRMHGHSTLWIPGTDHAGISTQVVVEKKLWKERKLTRHDLGREKFLEEVWKWKQEKGGVILEQFQRLGCSVDWSREFFSMDDKLSVAVREAFVRMHQEGTIYRAKRLVNWCCTLKSAISDIEVDHMELSGPTRLAVPGHGDHKVLFGVLEMFCYKVGGSAEELVVATTRPETMLGDTAVAVNPDDPRYKHLHGKFLLHPFGGRKMPIILDSQVDQAFGTGAVKVTPAHDETDFQLGEKHHLSFVNILNEDGTINSNGGKFSGMKRFQARYEVLEALKALGHYRGQKPNPMKLAICSRTSDIIEPLLKPQWWVKCGGMAQRASQALQSGELRIVPEVHHNTWYHYLGNIRDWCISRQLWWGHRVPAYYITVQGSEVDLADPSSWVVGRSYEEAMVNAKKKLGPSVTAFSLTQDEDVLDTWFSSALFPFSVLGWPNATEDLARYYPTTLLETGHDILFFWVARMVMMGLHLTDKLPFRTVLLHAVIRDSQGRKMSKSLGNVIDPVDIIEGVTLQRLQESLRSGNLDAKEVELASANQQKEYPNGIEACGTDGLRFALCAYSSAPQSINLDIKRVVGYRRFCNKLWNVLRYVQSKISLGKVQPVQNLQLQDYPVEAWILSRVHATIRDVNAGFSSLNLAAVTSALYSFWLRDFCDVFVEATKKVLVADAPMAHLSVTLSCLCECTLVALKLTHPIMPFITEELYQQLQGSLGVVSQRDSIMTAAFPTLVPSFLNEPLEAEMRIVRSAVHAINSTRQLFGLTKQNPSVVIIIATPQFINSVLPRFQRVILSLASISELKSSVTDAAIPDPSFMPRRFDCGDVFISAKGLDKVALLTKLETKLHKLQAKLQAKAAADSSGIDDDEEEEDEDVAELSRLIGQLKLFR